MLFNRAVTLLAHMKFLFCVKRNLISPKNWQIYQFLSTFSNLFLYIFIEILYAHYPVFLPLAVASKINCELFKLLKYRKNSRFTLWGNLYYELYLEINSQSHV